MENKFNEEDKGKVIKYLNMVAKKARFDMDTAEIIEYHRLLNYMQVELLPKIEANVFQVKSIKEDKES
jgi:hypothetical protein